MAARTGGSTRPSLEDVAARAGVSRATASRVINGQSSVAADLRERVERAVDELGYVPNQLARALMTRRTNSIALVAPEPDFRVFADPFFSETVHGAMAECSAADLQLVMLLGPSAESMARVDRFLRSGAVDAFLLVSEHRTPGCQWLANPGLGIPLVVGGRPLLAREKALWVDSDNTGGAVRAAEHLLASGRRVLATVAGPTDMSAGIDRRDGFRAVTSRAGMPELVEHGDFTRESGRAAMGRLLKRNPDIDGVFAASDLMALGALDELRSLGRRVPDDVAVVGFDDNLYAVSATPALTTVHQDPVLLGRAMVRLYLAHHRPDLPLEPDAAIPNPEGATHLILPTQLVVRDSA